MFKFIPSLTSHKRDFPNIFSSQKLAFEAKDAQVQD